MNNKTFIRILLAVIMFGILIGSYFLGEALSNRVDDPALYWFCMVNIPFMGFAAAFSLLDAALRAGIYDYDDKEEEGNERDQIANRRKPAASRNKRVHAGRSGKIA